MKISSPIRQTTYIEQYYLLVLLCLKKVKLLFKITVSMIIVHDTVCSLMQSEAFRGGAEWHRICLGIDRVVVESSPQSLSAVLGSVKPRPHVHGLQARFREHLLPGHTHTHKHTHTHTHSQTRTHTHKHTHTLMHSHSHTHTFSAADMSKDMYVRTHFSAVAEVCESWAHVHYDLIVIHHLTYRRRQRVWKHNSVWCVWIPRRRRSKQEHKGHVRQFATWWPLEVFNAHVGGKRMEREEAMASRGRIFGWPSDCNTTNTVYVVKACMALHTRKPEQTPAHVHVHCAQLHRRHRVGQRCPCGRVVTGHGGGGNGERGEQDVE